MQTPGPMVAILMQGTGLACFPQGNSTKVSNQTLHKATVCERTSCVLTGPVPQPLRHRHTEGGMNTPE